MLNHDSNESEDLAINDYYNQNSFASTCNAFHHPQKKNLTFHLMKERAQLPVIAGMDHLLYRCCIDDQFDELRNGRTDVVGLR